MKQSKVKIFLALGLVFALSLSSLSFADNMEKEEKDTIKVENSMEKTVADMAKEDEVAKTRLMKYMDSLNEEILDIKGVANKENEKAIKELKDALKEAKELSKKELKDMSEEEKEIMRNIPTYEKNKEKIKGSIAKKARNIKAEMLIKGDKVVKAADEKSYTVLENNEIHIVTPLKNLTKDGKDALGKLYLNAVKKADYEPKIDTVTGATPKYKKDTFNIDSYDLVATEDGYTIVIKELPEDIAILKPIIKLPLMDKTNIEVGSMVFVENPMSTDKKEEMNKDMHEELTGKEALQMLKEKGIIEGYKDGSLGENRNITRAEIATILQRYFKFNGEGKSEFEDVKESNWFFKPVVAMSKNGILKGYQGKFNPKDTVTQAEYIQMLGTSLEKTEKNIKTKDVKINVPKWSKHAYDIALAFEIIHEKEIDGNKKMTRGEVGIILNRLVRKMGK